MSTQINPHQRRVFEEGNQLFDPDRIHDSHQSQLEN